LKPIFDHKGNNKSPDLSSPSKKGSDTKSGNPPTSLVKKGEIFDPGDALEYLRHILKEEPKVVSDLIKQWIHADD